MYSRWVPGNKGGESETIIGNWLKVSPVRRSQVILITKVGAVPGTDGKGLSAKSIVAGVEGSLRRLQTDHIDLYLSHRPDADTPIEQTLRAYESLIGLTYCVPGQYVAVPVSGQAVEAHRRVAS